MQRAVNPRAIGRMNGLALGPISAAAGSAGLLPEGPSLQFSCTR